MTSQKMSDTIILTLIGSEMQSWGCKKSDVAVGLGWGWGLGAKVRRILGTGSDK